MTRITARILFVGGIIELELWQEKKLLTKLLSMKKVLEKLGYTVSQGSTYCVFHENTGTPSAKYYDDSNLWWCFAEQKHYTVWDALELGNQDPHKVFTKIWSQLPEQRKQELIDEIGIETDVKIPYEDQLVQFRKGKITYKQLLGHIVQSIDQDDLDVLKVLYDTSRPITEPKNYDNYQWLGHNAKLSNYKMLTDGEYMTKVMTKCKPRSYITSFIKEHSNVLIIFNIVNGIPIGATMRSTTSKAFIDINNKHGIFYGIGNLDENFTYGKTITIVEGPKDRDSGVAFLNTNNILSIMTGAISKSQLKVLKYLTNKIILALDNDEVGKNNIQKFKKYNSRDYIITVFNHNITLKDFGDLIPLAKARSSELSDIVFNYKSQIMLGGL